MLGVFFDVLTVENLDIIGGAQSLTGVARWGLSGHARCTPNRPLSILRQRSTLHHITGGWLALRFRLLYGRLAVFADSRYTFYDSRYTFYLATSSKGKGLFW